MISQIKPSDFIIEKAVTIDGDEIEIEIGFFPALTGFMIEKRYKEFAASPAANVSFVRDVLSTASVVIAASDDIVGEARIPLAEPEAVNYYLKDHQTLDRIFGSILNHNGISREPEQRSDYQKTFEICGAMMAKAFVRDFSPLLSQAIALLNQQSGVPENV